MRRFKLVSVLEALPEARRSAPAPNSSAADDSAQLQGERVVEASNEEMGERESEEGDAGRKHTEDVGDEANTLTSLTLPPLAASGEVDEEGANREGAGEGATASGQELVEENAASAELIAAASDVSEPPKTEAPTILTAGDDLKPSDDLHSSRALSNTPVSGDTTSRLGVAKACSINGSEAMHGPDKALAPEKGGKRGIPEELLSKGAKLRSDMPDAHTPRGASAASAAAVASGAREHGPGQHLDTPSPHLDTPSPHLDTPSPHLAPNQPPGAKADSKDDSGGEQYVRQEATWDTKMAVQMVFVFDKPGGVGSVHLTGRLIIRRAAGVEAAGGEGRGMVGGDGAGRIVNGGVGESGHNANNIETYSETGESGEVVVNGEFVRILQDQDVALFEVAMCCSVYIVLLCLRECVAVFAVGCSVEFCVALFELRLLAPS